MTDLKPCPFCGGEANLNFSKHVIEDPYWIDCPKCRIETDGHVTEQEAVQHWNRRKAEEKTSDAVEILKKRYAEGSEFRQGEAATFKRIEAVVKQIGEAVTWFVILRYNHFNGQYALQKAEECLGVQEEWTGVSLREALEKAEEEAKPDPPPSRIIREGKDPKKHKTEDEQ